MKNKALGIIETYGYSNFIVALDIATKSANVSYTKHNFIREAWFQVIFMEMFLMYR
ncbi:BMC domain-containing protein [Caloramator sp. Dgby_cultured_2]|uniref:BMC domain-containing protein n=1 Tax=Caloramator sp. Dgby_cultured_2 TaxID=3029174 RepID=UPI00406BEC10